MESDVIARIIKKTAGVAALFLAAGPGILGAVPAAPEADARAVRRLQEKAGADQLLPLDADRVHLALALADVAAQAGGPQAGDWQSQDYDALFALLQQYREELAALGVKQAGVDAALEALKQRIADLEQRMEYLPPDGMKIHGRFNVLADDMLITGPGQFMGAATRFRKFKQQLELEFTAVHGPFLGVTRFDVSSFVGSYAAPQPQGVRRVYAEVRTPISLQIGDFTARMSPLTMWRNEDPDDWEPEPFKGRKKRLRDLSLISDDNKLSMRALRIFSDLQFGATSKTVEVDLIGSILAGPGEGVYQTADPTTGLAATSLSAAFMTYFAGWRFEVEPVKGWKLAYLGSKTWDEPDTGSATYGAAMLQPQYAYLLGSKIAPSDNEIHAAKTSFDVWKGKFKAEVEYAMSSYTNANIGRSVRGLTQVAGVATDVPMYFANPGFQAGDPLAGSALRAEFSVGEDWGKLSGTFRQVGDSFVSAAAQTRTMDRNRNPYGPFFTENVLYNPAGGTQFFNFGGFSFPDYAQSILNGRMIPAQTMTTSDFNFKYLIPADKGFNSSQPYGWATPNRMGYGAKLDFKLFNGLFQPSGKVDMASQIEKDGGRAQEVYVIYGGGLVVDLKPSLGWPIRLTSGYRLEDTRNTEWVAFTSTLLDAGLEYYPVESTGVFLGFRHIDYNGTIFNPESTYAPLGMFGVHQLYESFGIGIRHTMGDRINIDVLYTHQDYPNRDAALTFGQEVAYKIDEASAKFSVDF